MTMMILMVILQILLNNLGQQTAYIVHPELTGHFAHSSSYVMEEAQRLAEAIELSVLCVHAVKVSKIQAGAFLGKGHREYVAAEIEELKPDVVIVNHTLSPVQQRNLEKEWGVKVIDRTGLILEIFGARAQTKEGRLQVQLAALDYQRSRLVRSWTHLERQRGATGFIGGPGETQIEIDRRLIGDQIVRLRRQLDKVRRTRNLAREARDQIPLPVIALIGYTNAGKSTLFNRLTGANVMAEDLLFATLDPTMRRMRLPNKQKAILSDTVGFISDLPTHLIEAFKATLEQIDQAEIIVHVRDVSDPYFEQHKRDVVEILSGLGIDYEADERVLEVYNKIDLIDAEKQADFVRSARFRDDAVMVSALNGDGMDDFFEGMIEKLNASKVTERFVLEASQGRAIAWLYEHGEILTREDGGEDGSVALEVLMSSADLGKFRALF